MDSLVAPWRALDPLSAPYVLGTDRWLLEQNRAIVYRDFDDYVSRGGPNERDNRFHLGLRPFPYGGDLQRARIFLLMLNPGLHDGDYYAESHDPMLRKAMDANLRQEGISPEHPFFLLDPRFSYTPGYDYWNSKLWGIMAALADGSSIGAARQRLAQELALIQLVPYHSRNFDGSGRVVQRLSTPGPTREFVQHKLIPRAEAGEALIIATRQVREWNLKPSPGVHAYTAAESRSAHLSPASSGGKLILKFLRQNPPA